MKNRKIRCKNCGNYFYPDNYNRHNQKYCSRDECRKASHTASSKKYRKNKSKNAEFRQQESTRVQLWQFQNPNYRKKSSKKAKKDNFPELLRDFAQVENMQNEITLLRDFANLQYHVIEGLIITLTGDVLRDNIGEYIRQMYDKSREVSGIVPEKDFIMQFKQMRTNNGKKDINQSLP